MFVKEFESVYVSGMTFAFVMEFDFEFPSESVIYSGIDFENTSVMMLK